MEDKGNFYEVKDYNLDTVNSLPSAAYDLINNSPYSKLTWTGFNGHSGALEEMK